MLLFVGLASGNYWVPVTVGCNFPLSAGVKHIAENSPQASAGVPAKDWVKSQWRNRVRVHSEAAPGSSRTPSMIVWHQGAGREEYSFILSTASFMKTLPLTQTSLYWLELNFCKSRSGFLERGLRHPWCSWCINSHWEKNAWKQGGVPISTVNVTRQCWFHRGVWETSTSEFLLVMTHRSHSKPASHPGRKSC